jgi:hypothetical protein
LWQTVFVFFVATSTEYFAEMFDQPVFNLSDRYITPHSLPNRRYASIRNSARHDELEVGQVGRYVEGKSMTGDPA